MNAFSRTPFTERQKLPWLNVTGRIVGGFPFDQHDAHESEITIMTRPFELSVTTEADILGGA
jgi:hypothetical protein